MNLQQERLRRHNQLAEFAGINGRTEWLGITVGLHWEWEGRRYGTSEAHGEFLGDTHFYGL